MWSETWGLSGQTEDLTDASILRFIEHGPGPESKQPSASYAARISQIQTFLQNSNDVQSARNLLRLSASPVVPKLLGLVLSIVHSHESAEQQLCDYLCRCFLSELAQSKHTKFRLERIVDEADTDNLVLAIDGMAHASAPLPNIFPQSQNGPGQSNYSLILAATAVDFESSDPFLSRIYQVFLLLASHKSPPESYEDVLPYVSVMISFYKHKTGVETFDSKRAIDVNKRVLDYLCGSDAVPGIVPPRLRDYALDTLLRVYDKNLSGTQTSSHQHEETLLPVSQRFTKAEMRALVSDFETVISTLKEFDSQLDASLLMAFRNYVFFAYEVFPELPVWEDYLFIDSVADAITAVVEYVAVDDYPEDPAIGEIIMKFRGIQNTLLDLLILLTLLMRLTISETANSRSFARTCLRKWNRETLIASQLDIIYEEECLPRLKEKHLRSAFLTWRRRSVTFHRLQSESESYFEKKHLSHYLNQKWIKSMLHIIEMNGEMERLRLAKFLKLWNTRLKIKHEMELALESHFDSICISRSLGTRRIKFDQVKSLKESAASIGGSITSGLDLLLRSKVWEHWKLKLDVLPVNGGFENITVSEKLVLLNQQSRRFLLTKYIGVLRSRSSNHNALRTFQEIRNKHLKKHFLGIWKMKKYLSNMQSVVAQDRILSLKQSAFDCWFDQTRTKLLADKTLRCTLLKKYWKSWKTKEAACEFHLLRSLIIRGEYLKEWILKYKSASIIRKTDRKTVTTVLNSWTKKFSKIMDNEDNAELLSERFATSGAMTFWKSRMATNFEMKVVADLNFQRKFLNKIWGSHSRVCDQNSTATEILKQGLSFNDRTQIKVALKKWQEVYLLRYEEEARQALTHFQRKVKYLGALSVFFKHWRDKHRKLRKHKDLLEKNLLFFNNTNILKSEFLMHWIDMSRANTSAMDKSVDFYRSLLRKKFLLVWYEKFVTKARYLSDIADDFINRREYTQMVEILRKWNLTFTKNFRRNQQTCDMFVEKWERNNLKSLFELWVYKARKKGSRMLAVDQYAEADTTFGSHTSPLSKKFIGSGASLEYLDGASYLYTPVKKQVPRLPFTPAKSNTRPTRLQETNQKMKSTKMDALTNRYKLAKEDSGYGKNKLHRSESTKLPPPTLESSPTRLPMRPPPAPRFETYTNGRMGPEATSSPEQSLLGQERSSAESETRMLETAKRLQRIKPVVIPQSGNSTEIRYSPIRKLRERLQSRTESLQSPTNIFDP
ncbi:hypothetical protein METBIDRAFT_36515 [Metschnikowia bicuspidata var. bicuspidata NRRL YB-4993]|uniref:Sfi1 spindle body domain-containing protein n=1 Tax=Metschnikowia bicuspidata var. bicuspidata NRRL YB-4993 TaxID=869754 RepID=A0A1A0HIA9_9ASCO|nr:hypothetical protein METBIDRAFT_36515 [Metschnikowia bicuspidata var. bicuspidata NRRL YB-4993]OBA23736.1 hypothetical protein METBIDRAFT_36515 [Metschnikowia bicuspidata var. bicuspidata NRRL YB-4993]